MGNSFTVARFVSHFQSAPPGGRTAANRVGRLFLKKQWKLLLSIKSHVLQVHEHPSQENIQNVKLAIQLASGNTLSFTR